MSVTFRPACGREAVQKPDRSARQVGRQRFHLVLSLRGVDAAWTNLATFDTPSFRGLRCPSDDASASLARSAGRRVALVPNRYGCARASGDVGQRRESACRRVHVRTRCRCDVSDAPSRTGREFKPPLLDAACEWHRYGRTDDDLWRCRPDTRIRRVTCCSRSLDQRRSDRRRCPR